MSYDCRLFCSFGVIAFQEIAKKEAMQKICDELNNPTLPSISKWRGARGHWEFYVSQSPTGRMFQGVEYNGFLYDTEQEVALLSAALVDNSPDNEERSFVRKPFVGHFKVCVTFSYQLHFTLSFNFFFFAILNVRIKIYFVAIIFTAAQCGHGIVFCASQSHWT